MPTASNRSAATELFVDFDGRQCVVRTDVQEIVDFVARLYSSMLVPSLVTPVGEITVSKIGDQYVVRSEDTEAFRGPALRTTLYVVKRDILSRFVHSRPDLLWVHAGAVERADRSLLIAGEPGRGKSTLVTLLCKLGWSFLTDDSAPIRLVSREIVPFPQMPHRRIHPGRHLAPDEFGMLEREDVEIPTEGVRRTPAVIGALVFPHYHAGVSSRLDRCTPGEAALEALRHCTNFPDHKEIAVAGMARLASLVPAYRLFYDDRLTAAALLDKAGRAESGIA